MDGVGDAGEDGFSVRQARGHLHHIAQALACAQPAKTRHTFLQHEHAVQTAAPHEGRTRHRDGPLLVQQDFETAELSPMARSFYGENKRVANLKSKSELGLSYAYPNYRTAFARMWAEGSWR